MDFLLVQNRVLSTKASCCRSLDEAWTVRPGLPGRNLVVVPDVHEHLGLVVTKAARVGSAKGNGCLSGSRGAAVLI